jgi:6-methylsalicylate decarboxylase
MHQVERARIDVHHHMVPPAFAAEMRRRGIAKVAGADLPDWVPAHSVRVMDANGIKTAVLSLSAPGVYFGSLADAIGLARACNEFGAAAREAHPGRFGFFAVLPMPFTAEACSEAAYALDVLKADGVVLLGSTDGKFLGNRQFDELMAELDARHAVVLVHPNIHPSSDALDLTTPGFFVEFMCDTTRAAVNMIFTNTLARYPRIRFVLAHAGGFLPYIGWRLSLANAIPAIARHVPAGVLHEIRKFYFDTALSPSAYAMAALRGVADPAHILFGSDYPFAPAMVVGMEVRALEALPMPNKTIRLGVDRANAERLFPQFADHAEAKRPASATAKLRDAAIRVASGLGEAARNR